MRLAVLLILIISELNIFAQVLPKPAFGKIEHLEKFASEFVTARNVDVWLPENYSSENKYSVIYMQDGQNLFDSTQTWNKKEWKADEVISKLIDEKKIPPCIVVGIWNVGDERLNDYFPNKIFENIEPETRQSFINRFGNGKPVNGDNYLKFIVKELKPYIDDHFSTYSEKENTVIMGSSMGALISLYAISEYPEIFGGAGCISTAWLSFIEPNYSIPLAVFNYLAENLPSPENHKIYMDYGTGESDDPFELTQSFVDLIAKGKGFDETIYSSVVYENEQHEENSWSRRLHVPITFLFKNDRL